MYIIYLVIYGMLLLLYITYVTYIIYLVIYGVLILSRGTL